MKKHTNGNNDAMQTRYNEIYPIAIQNAKKLGRNNLPGLDEPTLDKYLAEIKGGYSELIAIHCQESGNETEIAEQEKNSLASRLEFLETQLKNDRAELKLLKLEHGEHEDAPVPDSNRKLLKAMVIGLGFIDAVLFKSALAIQQSEQNYLQLGIFAALVLFFCCVPRLIAKLYRRFEHSPYRWFYMAGTAAIVIAGYSVIAITRSKALANDSLMNLDATGESVAIPWYMLAITNLLFLAIAVVAEYFLPTEQEQKKITDAEKREKTIEKLEKRIAQMEAEKAEMPAMSLQAMRSKTDATARRASNKARIQSLYEQTIAAFKQTNLEWRTDGQVPQAFNNPNLSL